MTLVKVMDVTRIAQPIHSLSAVFTQWITLSYLIHFLHMVVAWNSLSSFSSTSGAFLVL